VPERAYRDMWGRPPPPRCEVDGCGKMAAAQCDYLTPRGTYRDICRRWICRQHAEHHPHDRDCCPEHQMGAT
jgi:hypothetical protein